MPGRVGRGRRERDAVAAPDAVPGGIGLWPADCGVRWADAFGRGDRRRVRVRRREGVGYGGLDNRLPDCCSACSAVDQPRRGGMLPRDKAAAGWRRPPLLLISRPGIAEVPLDVVLGGTPDELGDLPAQSPAVVVAALE